MTIHILRIVLMIKISFRASNTPTHAMESSKGFPAVWTELVRNATRITEEASELRRDDSS